MYPKVLVVILFVIAVSCVQGLPATTYPIAYDLWINTVETRLKDNFDGRVEIMIEVAEQTNEIVLSYDYRTIVLHNYQAELFEIQNDLRIEIPTKRVQEQNSWMEMTIEIEEEGVVLAVGKKYLVIVNFTTYLENVAKGVYFTGEVWNERETQVIATNFMPNYARQAFPCYDEPIYKAPIKLTIVDGSKYKAISNMPIETQSTDDELALTTTIFQTTPALSIHSFGFVISEFKNTAVTKQVKYVAYYDEKHDSDDVELLLDSEEKILAELENYLGADVGLVEIKEVPQYDTIYMKVGLYGLLLYDQQYYYCDSTETIFQQEEVIRRTARLISNQFFSNLITPNAWQDAWITHGISVLLEYSILTKDFPHLKTMDTFLVKLYNFMSYKRVYYIPQGVEMTRSLIDRSYEWKSVEFMYMLQNVVSEKVFHIFLQKLVAEYRNIPISTAQFIDMLTEISHEHEALAYRYDFATILDTWLNDAGGPVLIVTRDYETGKVTLNQTNLLYWGSTDTTWWVPYNYIIENSNSDWSTIPNGWMENTTSIELDFGERLNASDWILFNVKQSCYYHTVYDHENWLLLAAQLSADHEKVHYINRGHLVSDSFLFGYDKYVSLELAFATASYLHKEQSTFPFRLLFSYEFNEIDRQLYATDVYQNYTIFMRHQMQNIYERIRVTRPAEELEYDEMSIRSTITKFACRMHLKECLEDANKVFENYYERVDQIDSAYESDLGQTLITYGFIMCNETLFWNIFNRINTGMDEENYYVDMIGMVEDPLLTQYLVAILLTPNGETYNGTTINLDRYVRLTIFETLIGNNVEVLDTFYELLDEQFDRVREIYDWYLGMTLVRELFIQTTTEERLEKITKFSVKYETQNNYFDNDIYKATAIVKWNVERIVEFKDVLAGYVEKIQEEENKGDESSATYVTVSILTILIMPLIVTFIA